MIRLITTDISDSIITGVTDEGGWWWSCSQHAVKLAKHLFQCFLSWRCGCKLTPCVLFSEFTPTSVELCGTLLGITETFLLTKNFTSPSRICPPDTSKTQHAPVKERILLPSNYWVLYQIELFFRLWCRIRELSSMRIGTLVKISGQVVRTHPVHPELVTVPHLTCK